MRCLAIAQAWHDDGGVVTFAMAEGVEAMAPRLERDGAEVVRVELGPEALGRLAREIDARVGVLDGYAFGVAEQEALCRSTARAACVEDDGVTGRWVTDFIIDPNVFASEARYGDRAPHTRLLLGSRYALLRREFTRHGPKPEQALEARNVLVSFGGADPARMTARAIAALAPLRLDVTVLVGAANDDPGVGAAAERVGMRALRDAPDVPSLMAAADVALVAAGGTCSELAYMGVPALAVITADNQRRVAEGFASRGSLRSLGDAAGLAGSRIAEEVTRLLDDHPARVEMAARGRALVDGLGARRVVRALKEGSG